MSNHSLRETHGKLLEQSVLSSSSKNQEDDIILNDNQYQVRRIALKYGANIEDAKKVLNILGYEIGSKYSEIFFNSSSDPGLYVKGAKIIEEQKLRIEDIEVSLLEIGVRDCTHMFNFKRRELKQE